MDKTNRTKKSGMAGVLVGVGLMLVAAVMLAVLILKEDHKSVYKNSGESKQTQRVESVTCESSTIRYPFFEYDNATGRNLRITASMAGEELRAVSLQYILYYNSADEIINSEAVNHAAMNNHFYVKGLGTDAIGALYAKLSDAMRFSLYQAADTMVESEKEFLLLDKASGYSKDSIKEYFEGLGMECE